MEVWRREFIEVLVVTSSLTTVFGQFSNGSASFTFDSCEARSVELRQYANRSEHAVANSKYTGLLGVALSA